MSTETIIYDVKCEPENWPMSWSVYRGETLIGSFRYQADAEHFTETRIPSPTESYE